MFPNYFTVTPITGFTKFIIGFTGFLGVLVVVLSVYHFFSPGAGHDGFDKERAAAAKEIFEDVVIKTLVPIFNTLIASMLAWIFGKPMVNSFAQRIVARHLL